MSPEDFKAWRERMNFNRTEAAEALGIGRNQPQKYEEGLAIPRHIELACQALEFSPGPHMRDLSAVEMADETRSFLSGTSEPQGRQKEIVAVTMHRAGSRPIPAIHRFYVDWFDSNGLRDLPKEIENRLMVGLKTCIINENRRMERSGLGNAPASMFFEDLMLLGIFTTDRSKALIDHWAYPLDLHEEFYSR